VSVWDAATGKRIGLRLASNHFVNTAAIRADGRMVAAGGDGGIHIWELPPPMRGTPTQVRLRIELHTGLELDEQGVPHELSLAEEEHRRRQLEKMVGPP
jgi:hypothetical protein